MTHPHHRRKLCLRQWGIAAPVQKKNIPRQAGRGMYKQTAPPATEPGPLRGTPRLNVRFVEWMMCLPDGWVIDIPGISRRQQLTMLGNGVVPPQAAAALEDMLTCIPEEERELHSR